MLSRAALIALLAFAVPATAAAGTMSKTGGVVTYTPADGDVDETVYAVQDSNASPAWILIEGATAGSGCVTASTGSGDARNGAKCAASGTTRVELQLGGGDDSGGGRELFFFRFCFPPFFVCPDPVYALDMPVTVDGGAGDDLLLDGNAADQLRGGDGADTLSSTTGRDALDGGAGADTLNGGAGDDVLDGGGGRDLLRGGNGDDVFGGGDGFDTVDYTGQTAPVKVTIDDRPDDGRADTAEHDDVRRDVEGVIGGTGADVLIGNELDNELSGGPGQDQLEGGGGFDAFYGEEDGATILARDGNPERVDCGDGPNDFAQTDSFDSVADCENNQASSELQGDLDNDGFFAPADCDDSNTGIHPGAADIPDNGVDEDCSGADATNTDRDNDGFRPPFDCDDSNAAIHPGAQEVFGNSIDEDCSGSADPLQTIDAFVQSAFRTGKRTLVRRLRVRNLAPGILVRALCRGGKKRGCRVAKREFQIARPTRTLDLRKPLRLRRLRGRAEVQVQILRPDSIGEITRLRFRSRRLPAISTSCLRPGSTRRSRCP